MSEKAFHAHIGRFMEPKQALDFEDATSALGWFFREAARMCDDYNLSGEVHWTAPDGREVQLVEICTGKWRLPPPPLAPAA
jgi:hypothetical protein